MPKRGHKRTIPRANRRAIQSLRSSVANAAMRRWAAHDGDWSRYDLDLDRACAALDAAHKQAKEDRAQAGEKKNATWQGSDGASS